jgi:hypothetical protein
LKGYKIESSNGWHQKPTSIMTFANEFEKFNIINVILAEFTVISNMQIVSLITNIILYIIKSSIISILVHIWNQNEFIKIQYGRG